jgi:hypothetical protein
MIKHYHELTEDEFNHIINDNPDVTWGWLQENYPQPDWCIYPDAVADGPIMVCMSLMGFNVHGKSDCASCEFNKDAEK